MAAAAAALVATAPRSATAASSLVRGASPDNIDKYAPKDGKFTCFDGSRTIDFAQVRRDGGGGGGGCCTEALKRCCAGVCLADVMYGCACPHRSTTTSATARTAATSQVREGVERRDRCSDLDVRDPTAPLSCTHAGTAACPNGVFYCRNRGHEPKLLATSFVDDGVCGGWRRRGWLQLQAATASVGSA
jgi:hypothetical protein